MAEVITRFKLETTQYDSKLRDASKSLSEFARNAASAGEDFSKLSKESIEAAQAFGRIGTNAMTSKGKVQELVGAFNDVAKVYNKLTAEQQQSDFGKALAESMTTLKGRISEAKEEMNSTGGILGQLKDKFTVNIDALKLFNAGLTAAKAALDVAKDAFFANEQSLDEWGRIVESSESLYKGFLDALNTGDVSGYLQRIDEITQAARDAYNALDELNTFNAFNQINVEKTRTGMTEAIADYRGGKGNKDTVKAAGEAYKKELEERKKLEKEAYIAAVGEVAAQRGVSRQDLLTALSGSYGSYQSLKNLPLSGTKTVYYGGGMFGGGGSYEQAVPGSVQEKLGDALRRLNDDELKHLQSLGAQAERTGNEVANVDKQINRILNGRGGSGGGGRSGGSTKTGPTYDVGSLAEAQADVQRLTKLWNEAGADVRNKYLQPLIEAEQKVKDMQNAMNLAKEQAQGRLLGGEIKSTTYTATVTADTQEALDKLREINGIHLDEKTIKVNVERETVQTTDLEGTDFKGFAVNIPDISNGLKLDNLPQHLAPLQQLNAELARLKELLELAPNTEAYQAGLQDIADKEKEIAQFKGTSNLGKDADNSAKSFQSAASAISQVGSALNSIEDPTAKIMGIVAQAIAGVAAGAGQAVSAKDTTASGWAWIGAAAAITASMIAMISQIHSATGYQNGGIVKGYSTGGTITGSSYSGDKIGGVVDGSQFVGLNAGELVLNASQQSMLASNLQNSGGGRTQIVGVLKGEDVVLMADRWGMRTGRGELLFGKNL